MKNKVSPFYFITFTVQSLPKILKLLEQFLVWLSTVQDFYSTGNNKVYFRNHRALQYYEKVRK